MGCTSCGDKPTKTTKDFTRAVIEINNPEALILLRKVVVPSSMGDEEAVPPAIGKYHNTLLYYEASGNSYLYSSDGIPTKVTGPKGEQGPEGPEGRDGRDGAIQYTAGTGIDISASNVISATGSASVSWGDINGSISNQADLSDALAAKQNTLTAGANIAIDANNEISATDTTYSNFTGTDGVSAGAAGLVPGPTTSDTDKYLKSDGTWATVAGGGGPTVVQTTGTSTTDVMSQNAVTSALFADPGTKQNIKIGTSPSSGTNSTAIGNGGASSSTRSVAIGYSASSTAMDTIAIGMGKASVVGAVSIGGHPDPSTQGAVKAGSIALGYGATTSEVGEMNIGSSSSNFGYNNTNYRRLSGVHDPVGANDAATKGYVDTNMPVITMTSTDPGEGATLAANNFIGVYQ